MATIFYHIIFLVFTLYLLLKCIGYGIYEIKEENNKYGGIAFIVFAVFCIVSSNVIMWFN